MISYRGNMHCGGQGIYLWHLARELSRLGHTVDVLVGPPYPDPMPFARSVVRLPNQEFWAKWFLRDRRRMLVRPNPLRGFEPLHFYELAASRLGFLPEPFAFSWRAFRALVGRLRGGAHYDVAHDVQCLGYGLLAIRALGVPVVTTVHHPLTVDRRASFVRDESFLDTLGTMEFYPVGMQSFVARRLDGILTSSDASARTIVRDFRVRVPRVHNVWNGVDTERFRPDPTVEHRAFEVLCVGRAADPNKGVATLVEAIARLPRHVTLTLVDENQPGNAARVRARELGCADRVEIVGRVSTAALVGLYRRAALVAVPSRYEGFGLPAVEAMACGTPVVASDAGALPEVLGVAAGGILVEPDDPEALAKAIARLLDLPEARMAMGRRARARVEAAFAWPRVAEATARVYDEVLATRVDLGRPASTTTSANAGSRRAS